MEVNLSLIAVNNDIEIILPQPSRDFDFLLDANSFVNKNTSAHTKKTYAAYINSFFRFLDKKNLLFVTPKDVLKWRSNEERLKRSPNTIKTKLACIRSFFEYWKEYGVIPINPASTKLVAAPKVADEPQGTALTPKQVNLLLALPKTETIIGARDYALILLMLRTFMRVSEALSLREDDFFHQRGRWNVRVKIKGGEIRSVPIPNDVKKAIDWYHLLDRDNRSYIKTEERDSRYIFMPLSQKKTHSSYNTNVSLTARHVWHIVRAYGEDLFKAENLLHQKAQKGGDNSAALKHRSLTPHDFRRTAITRALDQGESYRRVQNAARLKSITTVQRYDHHRQAMEENSILTLNYDEK